MIKYFCDHCGKEIRKLDNLREIEYGWSSMGCNKNIWKGALHKKCLASLNKHIQGFLEASDHELVVDK